MTSLRDMPIYEYGCDTCGHRFEKLQRMGEPPVIVCASCGAASVRRLISATSFSLKGSGWYVTDYARRGKADADGMQTEGRADSTATKGGPTC